MANPRKSLAILNTPISDDRKVIGPLVNNNNGSASDAIKVVAPAPENGVLIGRAMLGRFVAKVCSRTTNPQTPHLSFVHSVL